MSRAFLFQDRSNCDTLANNAFIVRAATLIATLYRRTRINYERSFRSLSVSIVAMHSTAISGSKVIVNA